MTPAAQPDRRVLLAAGTESYRYGDLAGLRGVPGALGCVVETLTALGYRSAAPGGADVPSYLLDPGLTELKDAVRAAAEAAPVVVVYYTGHGLKAERSPYYLVTAEATLGRLDDEALEARQIPRLVLRKDAHDNVLPGDEQPQVLVVLDCCFSGAGGIEALKESLEGMGNPKVWWLASASSIEYAQQGRFAAALRQALLDPDVGSWQELLGLDWVAERINGMLAQGGQTARSISPSGQSTGLTPFFPNPKYVPDVAGLTVAEQHWVSRLRGAPAETATAGFYVTGRTGRVRVVEDLSAWMRQPGDHGLAVVTGSPGCGKSAMLALPVLLTDPERRDTLLAGADPGSLVARAGELFNGLPVFGVHARGFNLYNIAAAIAEHLGRPADNPSDLLADLDGRPETSPRILVVDAVDEARDPELLLTGLLVPLARRAGLRVVAGARRHILAGVEETGLTIDLDTGEYQDPQALASYAYQLLIAAREPDLVSPYRGRHDDTALTVAAGIAEQATGPTAEGQADSFLLAQLLARAARGRPQVIDATSVGWAKQLPATVGTAFDEDLRRLLPGQAPIARTLLAALAWAKGPGLPWEGIWQAVARALAAHTGTNAQVLSRRGVRWLLDNAGAYIVEDLGPGQRSVFRPFHDLIAAHLRGQPSDEQLAADPTAGDGWRKRREQIEKDITRTLAGTVPATADGRPDWERAHPYLRTYLAQHAHAAGPGALAELAADLDYLTVADPAVLTPLLTPTDPALRPIAQPYRRARPLLGGNFRANAGYLQEAMVALTGSHPPSRHIRPAYQTLMARVSRDDSLLTLPGYPGTPGPVSFGTGPAGRLLLAVSDGDHTVRVWDPLTGAPAGEPLTGHTRWVCAVALGTGPDGRLLLATDDGDGTMVLRDPLTGVLVGEPITGHRIWVHSAAFGTGPDERLLLASSSGDQTVRVWDPLTGALIGEPMTHPCTVNSVALGTGADGRLLLATGCGDQTVRVWDPLTGAPASEPLTDHTDLVESVAFGTGADGRLRLASGGGDGMVWVWVWDPVTGIPAGGLLAGHTDVVGSVAFGTGADGRLLLATASHDGTVRVWDPVTGTPVGEPLTGHTRWVTSAAFGTGEDGRLLLATASGDGTVRVWDPVTGTPAGDPMTSHTKGVTSAAFGTGEDGRLLGTASGDGTVRVWDPVTGTPAGDPMTSHTKGVTSAAFGTGEDGRLLGTASGDGTVRVWDPVTGTPAGDPMTSHTKGVTSVAFGNRPGAPLLLASGSHDGTVRVWDPVTGTPAGDPMTGHTKGVTSVAFGNRPGAPLLLASGSYDGTVRVWDPVTGTPAGDPMTGHTKGVTSVAFGNRPGAPLLLASGSYDGTVRVWDPVTGTPVGEPLTGHPGTVTSVAFGTGEDGRLLLATASHDGTVRLWDPVTGAPVGGPLTGHTGLVTSVAFGTRPDGRLLLTTADKDGTVQVWDPVTGGPVGGPLTGHTDLAESMAFGTRPDGRLLLATASERTVRLWDPVTGACTATLQRRTRISSVAAAGMTLAIGDQEGISVIELNLLAAR